VHPVGSYCTDIAFYAAIALTASARRLSQLWTTSCNFS